jgi:hypothetical protein
MNNGEFYYFFYKKWNFTQHYVHIILFLSEALNRNVETMNGLAGPARCLLHARIFEIKNVLPLLLLLLAWVVTCNGDTLGDTYL